MELSPGLYHFLIRPKWFTKLYIGNIIMSNFDFDNKVVIDFGCGTGSISCMFTPENYLGIDCDDERIVYAKSVYPGYNFSVLHGNRLPMDDKSVDYILIVSVLHHISSEDLSIYLKEFQRLLKPNGKLLVIEPCFFKRCNFSNYFMSIFDKGKYIRYEYEYLDLFTRHGYQTQVLKRFSELYFYNKLFFMAYPGY